LDHEFVEFAVTVPERLKLHGFTTKYLLRKAFSGVVPDEVLWRPKEGFSVPLARWTRLDLKPLVLDLLLSPSPSILKVFRHDYIHEMVRQHLDGKANRERKVWNLLCLEAWCSAYGVELA
jgi:asparagine synthase (glutamine-hydrolysing)